MYSLCPHSAFFWGKEGSGLSRSFTKKHSQRFFMVSMTMVCQQHIQLYFVQSAFSLWAPTKLSLPSEVDTFMRSVQNGFDFKNTLAFRERHYVDTGLKVLQVEDRRLIHNMSKARRSWTQGEHANRMTYNQVLPALRQLRSMHSRKFIKRTE